MLRAVWQDELNPGDPATLAALITEIGLDADAVMKLGAEPRWTERRTADTQAALDRGVFGAPSYVIGDEIFWGQDRLDFVDRALAPARDSVRVDKPAGIRPIPTQSLYDTHVTVACRPRRKRGLHVANQLYLRGRFMWTTAAETPIPTYPVWGRIWSGTALLLVAPVGTTSAIAAVPRR